MARIRTIKPDFFTHAKITKMTPLARLFYVSLWCEADRLGRLKWDADTLKDRYFPRDKCDVDEMGSLLAASGLIRFYEVSNTLHIDIPGFLEHQVINNREGDSTLPPWSADAAVTRESGVRDAAYGKEGRKGREGKEGTTPIVPKGDAYSQEFQDLVAAYPKRQGTNPLPRAFKAFNAAIDRGATQAQLITAAKAYARTEVAGTKFCQQLATWLNGDEWKASAMAANVEHLNPEEAQWRMRCTGYGPSKYWNKDQWGPRPGEPGCIVPEHIIKETNADGMDPVFARKIA